VADAAVDIVTEVCRRWLGTWEGCQFELEEILPCGGERVVTLFTECGRVRGSGRSCSRPPLALTPVPSRRWISSSASKPVGANSCFSP
jgi:hypothetical protein